MGCYKKKARKCVCDCGKSHSGTYIIRDMPKRAFAFAPRRIVLRALDVPEFNVTLLQIQHQSHRGDELVSGGRPAFKASNGVRITSAIVPDYDASTKTLFVRGENRDRDNDTLTVPLSHRHLIASAIREYNDVEMPRKVISAAMRRIFA